MSPSNLEVLKYLILEPFCSLISFHFKNSRAANKVLFLTNFLNIDCFRSCFYSFICQIYFKFPVRIFFIHMRRPPFPHCLQHRGNPCIIAGRREEILASLLAAEWNPSLPACSWDEILASLLAWGRKSCLLARIPSLLRPVRICFPICCEQGG